MPLTDPWKKERMSKAIEVGEQSRRNRGAMEAALFVSSRTRRSVLVVGELDLTGRVAG
uniref:Uncharacterized protein n=1 Tax=Arundo donax TaxID=35708 RepID=A0A0A9C4B3_ARUDO